MTASTTTKGIDTDYYLSLLKVSEALGHAVHRNHDHNPGGCSACERLEKVVESLKIR